jgi:mRNA interferase ChpB
MRRGDIYLVALDPTEGQRGIRPVLAVSPDEFNDVTQVPVVLPVTSGKSRGKNLDLAPVARNGTAERAWRTWKTP